MAKTTLSVSALKAQTVAMEGVERKSMPAHILTFDVGTTGTKTCLFRLGTVLDEQLTLLSSNVSRYDLKIGRHGEAEQNHEDWWAAMREGTAKVLRDADVLPAAVTGIGFCAQMQALVLVDQAGKVLRPVMGYMDQRAVAEKNDLSGIGPRIAGIGLFKLLPWLTIAGGAAASVKDPIWKYHWVRRNEPEIFAKVHKWLDAKDYLVQRCTGKFVGTPDSAYATFLFDSRQDKFNWSKKLCRMLSVNEAHLPDLVAPDEVVGGLSLTAAEELGLVADIPVFSGGGDASLIGIGAGSVRPESTHVYVGTSGWVSTVTTKRKVDTEAMIASIVGARTGYYNYFAEHETSGKCLEWVRDHLALDDIGVYLKGADVRNVPDKDLIDYMCKSIVDIPAGSNGVIFAPWLHGNRSPFEDPMARGMFFNIGLDTGKRVLIRSVVEGIAFQKRWLLESQIRAVPSSGPIRFVGGGALSDLTCRILADVTGRVVEAVENPQNAGAVGAAVIVAAGLRLFESIDQATTLVRVRKSYVPDPGTKAVYDRNFAVFKKLYKANKQFFSNLNRN